MKSGKLVIIELTDAEVQELTYNRSEILKNKNFLKKIPISINSINIDEFEKALSLVEPYTKDVMNLFYFYEDGKDYARVF